MNQRFAVAFSIVFLTMAPLVRPVAAVDTDGDGLLDLIDVPGFDPSATGAVVFFNRGIEDLDGARLLTNVQLLSLYGNQITGLETADFNGLTNLQTLRLNSNRITSIQTGTFGGLTNLEELYLTGNRITGIESGTFDSQANVQLLSLSRNQITGLKAGTFDGMTNLKTLFLNNNRITGVESDTFDGLPNLQTLRLNNNQITSVESGTFDLQANLQELSLDENQITSLMNSVFDGLTSLQELRLNGNPIASLESGAFSGLTVLPELDLSGMQISSLKAGTFDGMTNLQTLRLNGNRITSLEAGAFDGLNNLHTLLLQSNELTELNLTGATFQNLSPCVLFFLQNGICVDDSIVTLVLDDVVLSRGSYDAIVGGTHSITDASLVGLTFADEYPSDLGSLLGISTLNDVTVDQSFYDIYADEFNAFDALDDNTVTVVPGLCDVNRDGSCNVADIDAMSQDILAGDNKQVDLTTLIHRPMPHGFGTYLGDADLNGLFDSNDLIDILAGDTYEKDVLVGWAEGDFNASGRFDATDVIDALADGGYENGPRPVPVPEPMMLSYLIVASTILIVSRRRQLT